MHNYNAQFSSCYGGNAQHMVEITYLDYLSIYYFLDYSVIPPGLFFFFNVSGDVPFHNGQTLWPAIHEML